MFKNYLNIAVRNLLKYRAYSFINITGLAIAISSALLIALYVRHELSFDKFHNNSGQIYRIVTDFKFADRLDNLALSAPPAGPTLKEEYPEVKDFTRLNPYAQKLLIKNGEKKFFEENIFFAESSIFRIFNFPLISGDKKTALDEPNTVVISESIAKKFFGSSEVLGKILKYDNLDGTFSDFKITGVFSDLPSNSHLQFSSLVSYKSLAYLDQIKDNWIYAGMFSYVILDKNADYKKFNQKIVNLVEHKTKAQSSQTPVKAKVTIKLQPLHDIHLTTNLIWDVKNNSNAQYIYVFSIVAVFLLAIAGINYVNLATARAGIRMKEIGIRKVLGAQRNQLIAQLMSESFVITGIATIFAIVIAEICLPAFNSLADLNLGFADILQPQVLLALLMITMVISIAAGVYPALYLTSFQPASILKGKFSPGSRRFALRKILVVSQFAISITMIVATAIVFMQLDFMQNKNLGFDKENIVAIKIQDTVVASRYHAIRDELSQLSFVKKVSHSTGIPGDYPDRKIIRVEGKSRSELEEIPMQPMFVEHDFFDAMGMKLEAGRKFSREMTSDLKEAVLINETAARQFGWSEPLGKRITWGYSPSPGYRDAKVVGVVKDINTGSLKASLDPMVFLLAQRAYALSYILVKLKPANMKSAGAEIEKVWKKYDTEHPMELTFLDQNVAKLYETEAKISQMFTYFSLLTIFIACLGLLGLASFTIERRTKEIGIRKVLGASLPNILQIVSKEFFILVIIANFIALPLGFWAMQRWLENFAYRVELSFIPFTMAGIFALIIALLTVSILAARAALNNPVQSLRYE